MQTAARPYRVERGKRPHRFFGIPTLVLAIGIVAAVMLIQCIRVNEKQKSNFALANAVMDMQNFIAVFHLWFEESIQGDPGIEPEILWDSLESSARLSESILNGGDTEHGLVLQPLEDPSMRAEAENIGQLVNRLRAIAIKRSEDPLASGIGSELDDQFDDVFRSFSETTRNFEAVIEQEQVRDHARSVRLLFGILAAWGLIVTGATVMLWSHEKKRIAAEDALRVANERLEAQAEELEKHRLRLSDLVEERTVELTAANRQLHTEILEHKGTLAALEESRNRFEKLSLEFHALLDAIPDSITLISPDLKILWANKGAKSFFGTQASEAGGVNCYRLLDQRSSPCNPCPVEKSLRTGKMESARIQASSGALWDLRAFPIRDGNDGITGVIEVSTDVTENHALQTESIRIAHLASLGELSAGVAHEINNPINGIINCAQIMVDASGQTGEGPEILGRIIKEGKRIATIVNNLLSFARRTNTEKIPVHVGYILSEALALCRRSLEKDGILLKVDLPPDLPEISANPQQIEQVFLNIINNSRHALNLKYPGPHQDKALEIQAAQELIGGRPHLKITFYDKGVGIPAAIMEKLMDPFFSTKPKGLGTGLGLSISHGIVSDHQGRFFLHSVEGEFTKAHVLLPVGDQNGSEDTGN